MALRLSAMLGDLDDARTVGDVFETTRHAGFGFLAAFLALASVPVPLLSLPFGLAVAGLGVQLALGRDAPWLPRRVRALSLEPGLGRRLHARLGRWSARLERLSRPRLGAFTRGRVLRLVGLGLLFEGIGLALPMPMPGGNVMFAAPIILYGVGLLEEDGAFVAAAHATAAVTLAAVIVFWAGIVQGVTRGAHWLASLVGS
jgi:hypothetical protein